LNESTETPLRILLLSDTNNPDWISVPLVGYNHAAALARIHRVTLVTRGYNRDAILRRNAGFEDVIGFEFGFWDRFMEWCLRYIFKGDHGSQAMTALRIPFYLMFESRAWRQYRKRLAAGEFDLVLRLTPVSPVIPSLMATRLKKLKIPFVLGPINGGLPWPEGYVQAQRQKEWVSNLRALYRYVPYSQSMYRDSSAIVVGSSQTWREHVEHRDRLFFIPENGIYESTVAPRPALPDAAPLRLVFVGRLVPYKACDLALKASAPLLKAGRAHFTVVGFGEEREPLEALCRTLGIDAAVTFTGEVTHAQAMDKLRESDVLVFPSIREFGGGVVFEALACGAVPIVSDYGGPGDIIEADIGFRIPQSDEATSLAAFTQVLEELDRDRAQLRRLSERGQLFARETLGWTGKARQMTRIFEWCLGRGPKPAFTPPARLAG
jgi:glycosyltransferase involved in cell wall biosynthesis